MSEEKKHSKADKMEKKSRKSVDDGEVKVEKKEKKEKSKDKSKNKDKKDKQVKKEKIAKNALLADSNTVDQSLASLFAVVQPAVKAALIQAKAREEAEEDENEEEVDDDADLSSIDGDVDLDDEADEEDADILPAKALAGDSTDGAPKRKRKRNEGDELEDAYMRKLTREEERDAAKAAAERAAKRQRANGDGDVQEQEGATQEEEDEDEDMEDVTDEDSTTPPPQHETQTATSAADDELLKANRTVFLANVSTEAITSKTSRKTLLTHLASFFPDLPTPKSSSTNPKPKVESLRFRSTPYAAAIPKKAAYAKKELMDATAKSTNAYAVYSTPALAREACQRLNGTTILSRHLRVDSVAHPAKIDNHRCIFVGNLGFVDDESNIQDANEAEGREIRKRGKEPADIEEGLWRTFAKCGNVESVRVIRDSTTRVGKGIAYVQFEDENAVEAALLYNEKKFPPMLPRKLRVSRAKAVKRNAKPGSGRPTTNKARPTGYQRKFTAEEQSSMGRTSKLFGRAAAAKQAKEPRARGTAANTTPLGDVRKVGESTGNAGVLGEGIRKPESFIFEGHRARSTGGKAGLKLGGKKKGTKVTGRSKAFKTKAKAKAGGGK